MKVLLVFDTCHSKDLNNNYYDLVDGNTTPFYIETEVAYVPRKGDEIVLSKNEETKIVQSLKNMTPKHSYTLTTLSKELSGEDINDDNAEDVIECIAHEIVTEYIEVKRNIFFTGNDTPIVLCSIG